MQTIDRDQVKEMIQQDAQLIEVLGRSQYRQQHLPKAINIPLQSLDRETTGKLQKDRPVIVYCHDYQ
jgi:rhodanese-related sulfurtransferase